ncbi:UDP-N-acetylglucosamine--N-acetylmuramyl-(pentapeptide) pyrophosphoryl-undecaprenol N-acetylglucosamine transferase [Maribacter spongiicola]|uniref:UDP-N-acetylglucosamine--N-acetylmuramyl-(pentapeptide) pyrophosphoryl-undecaprenol N-acetylglucosamine transferase n=1 Tax=Maribacter spongiicola TaxID=1206753 RepID=A0A4R7KBP2_9FLAO|nr:undecaprenyldiphospho-muramoylpentapeptide beta-N-acetylglucosaminyltransferase [Maribacter spongiicola]TDT50510.1 UDP-N-acetylglucosamine--N-acetylmuramyl-(pentapeptide) pyrophosphoryl-undecaprenol N-acetylglucosamine transferase [Maribacter spongiicola]
MGNYKFILSGGGTGGHIYPAIAIANELKRRHPDAEFLFVGAKDRMEMEKVPQAGYKIEGLWITGIQRKLTLKNLLFPIKLISSLMKANSIVSKFKPHAVIGTGGFASGPLLKMATVKGIPCVLQEQNSFAGITNKLLKDKVEKICVAYDGMERFFPKDKIVKTGNPVRSDLVELKATKDEAFKYFELNADKKTLLILGGSLGARRINELVADHLAYFEATGLQIIWQCGKGYYETYKSHQSENIKVHAFLNSMDKAYVASDFIISRAGAGAVSELCLVGKPTFFIPSPVVAEDHQTMNALSLVGHEAAIMIREKELESKFKTEFESVFKSAEKQQELSKNIKSLALPNATADICDEIEKLIQ